MPSKVDNVLVQLARVKIACGNLVTTVSHVMKTRDVSDVSVSEMAESMQAQLGRISECIAEITRVGLSVESDIDDEQAKNNRVESVRLMAKQILDSLDDVADVTVIKAGAAEILMEEALFCFTEGD